MDACSTHLSRQSPIDNRLTFNLAVTAAVFGRLRIHSDGPGDAARADSANPPLPQQAREGREDLEVRNGLAVEQRLDRGPRGGAREEAIREGRAELAGGALGRLEERDIDAATHAARAWLASGSRRLVEWNRAGLLRDARVYYDAQRGPFEDLCRDLPDGRVLLRELRQAEHLAEAPVAEPLRKEIAIQAYKAIKGEADKRGRR